MDLWRHAPLYYFLGLGLVCGMAGFRVGWRLRLPAALPLAQGAFGYVPFVLAWNAGGPVWAAAAEGAWAAGASVMGIVTFVLDPKAVDARVFRAAPYRAAMLEWLRTGKGPETRPGATALAHARELLVYAAAALVSANALSLVMGAILLAYMNAYVAALIRAARRPAVVALLGWNVWSLVRVAAYVALGTAAAAPLLAALGRPAPDRTVLPLAAAGLAGVVLDGVLKIALSRPCGRALGASVDLDAAARLDIAGGPPSLHLGGPP